MIRVVNEKKKYFSKIKINFRKMDFFSQLLENFSIFEKYCEKKNTFFAKRINQIDHEESENRGRETQRTICKASGPKNP